MAKNSLLTTKKKKKSTPRRVKSGIGGISADKGYKYFHQKVHSEVESKEYVSIVKGYVRKAYDKPTAQAIAANPDYKISSSGLAAWCYWTNIYSDKPFAQGDFPEFAGAKNDEDQYNQSTKYYTDKLAALAESGKELVAAKKVEEKVKGSVYKPSIQERMREQLSDIIGQFEEWTDLQPSNDIPAMFDYLKSNTVAQAHIGKIRSYYEPVAAEFQALTQKDCPEDLAEGYKHLSKADIKQMIKFFDTMFGDLDAYANLKKATRATRKPKPKSADKLVAKLKFKKDDDRYKIVSVDPTTVVGATELWVFNTKNRKLGKYVAQEHATLMVKGTTLQFFDDKLSVQKTLRKPEAQLKEFGKAGKVVLRKFMDDIKATETKMNGRLNEHIVLLKVSK
jgi:hypothetical protein